METKQKLINIAKRYFVEDDEIIFKDCSGNITLIKQKENKIIIEKREKLLNSKVKDNNYMEVCGILRTLLDDYGQSICNKKRLMELIKFLHNQREVLIWKYKYMNKRALCPLCVELFLRHLSHLKING